jgi:hypothetical protein
MNPAEQSLLEVRAMVAGHRLGRRLNVGPLYPPASAPARLLPAKPEDEAQQVLAWAKSRAIPAPVESTAPVGPKRLYSAPRRQLPGDREIAVLLRRRGPTTSRELMDILNLEQKAVTAIWQRMTRHGLLDRDRVKVTNHCGQPGYRYRLTPAGEKLAE